MRKRSGLAYVWALSLLGACDNSSGVQGPVLEPGSSIYTTSTYTLVVENEGGGAVPAPPPGSTCPTGARHYSLTLASQQLTWTRCIGSSTMAYHEVTGKHLLTTTEYYDFLGYLDLLTVAKPDTDKCLTGMPVLSATVYTSGGIQKYVDDGSQCMIKSLPIIERTGVSVVLNRLDQLAGF